MLKVFFNAKYSRRKGDNLMQQTLIALLAVTLGEMGDKTQLLAMAFATRYKASKVMIGVFVATIFNHGLAVAVGNLITKISGLEIWIQGIAALSFIFFGLWTIRGDKLEGEDKKVSKFGPVLTVTIAFFIAELGDKTQLATIALASRFPENPFGVLLGTTMGMLVADAIGIAVGVVLCKRIPEKTIKLISAGVFILFGFIASFEVGTSKLGLSLPSTLGILAVLALITAYFAYKLVRNRVDTETPDFCRMKTVNDQIASSDDYKNLTH
jgi:putative Ca2+/H+ antiporter (TMEM165/GDT1 family)